MRLRFLLLAVVILSTMNMAVGQVDTFFSVPVADAPLLKATLVEMAGDPGALANQVAAARAKMASELGTANFIRQHVALSREVLGLAR